MKKLRNSLLILPFVCLALFCFACSDNDDDDDALLLYLLQISQAEEVDQSRVRVIHADTVAPSVNVAVDDVPAYVNLEYGTTQGYVGLEPGPHNIKVAPAADPDNIVYETDLAFLFDITYTLFAMTPQNGEGVLLPIVATDERDPLADQVKIRFIHASPDAPEVDIAVLQPDGSLVNVFEGLSYTQVTPYAAVNPASYSFVVSAAGSGQALITYEPVTLEAGQVLTVLALGTLLDDLVPSGDARDLDDFPFTVRAFVDNGDGDVFLDLAPTAPKVRVIHLSNGAPAVDIAVDEAVAIEGLDYGLSSGYANIPNGNRRIQVIGAVEGRPVVFDAVLAFSLLEEYTVFATFDADNVVAPIIGIDDRASEADKAKLRFLHASPDEDLTNVDVGVLDGENFSVVFDDTNFRDLAQYVTVDPGEYVFGVDIENAGSPLSLSPVTLNAGDVLTVVAFGELDNEEFPLTIGAFVDNDPGTAFVALPIAAGPES